MQQEAQTVLTIDLSENDVLGPAYLRGREEGQLELLRQPNRAEVWRRTRVGRPETVTVFDERATSGWASRT